MYDFSFSSTPFRVRCAGSRLWLPKWGLHQGQYSLTRERNTSTFFLESQMLYRTLVSIFCRLQQVLLGRWVKVEGTGLFPHYWNTKYFAVLVLKAAIRTVEEKFRLAYLAPRKCPHEFLWLKWSNHKGNSQDRRFQILNRNVTGN